MWCYVCVCQVGVMVTIASDAASECLGLVGLSHWMDGSVRVVDGLVALKTQYEPKNSWLT